MLSDSISWISSAVVCSIGEARFAGNRESKWHLVGDNLAALVAWPFILLSIIQSEKINRNQISRELGLIRIKQHKFIYYGNKFPLILIDSCFEVI